MFPGRTAGRLLDAEQVGDQVEGRLPGDWAIASVGGEVVGGDVVQGIAEPLRKVAFEGGVVGSVVSGGDAQGGLGEAGWVSSNSLVDVPPGVLVQGAGAGVVARLGAGCPPLLDGQQLPAVQGAPPLIVDGRWVGVEVVG